MGTTGEARNDTGLQTENIQCTLDAVQLAQRLGCNTFIGAGSQAEYGRVEGRLDATTPTFPENGYGVAKLCAGQLSRIECEKRGMRHIWTRILSVYGPWDGESSMVTSTINKLLRGESPSLTPGEQQWDYLYSGDAARALLAAGERGVSGKVYCIGSGQARPLKEYIDIMRNQIDPTLPLGFGEVPYGEKQVMYLCGDISDLTRDTGFVPETDFETGISKTIDWLQKENSHENN
jgi:nucleoside-diphosphate-sugar epimerase